MHACSEPVSRSEAFGEGCRAVQRRQAPCLGGGRHGKQQVAWYVYQWRGRRDGTVRPRRHLVTYHGVLASASPDRALVVPDPPEGGEARCTAKSCGDERSVAEREGEEAQRPGRPRRGYRWAELMQRVFEIEVLVCDHCGGRRRVLTFLTDPPVLRAILEHLGLPADPPPVAPARPPPEPELPFA